jgi:hypothetical protein
MYINHYEANLLLQYKNQFNTFLILKCNLGAITQKEKNLILRYFDKKITTENIKNVYSLPLIVFFNLLIKNQIKGINSGAILNTTKCK